MFGNADRVIGEMLILGANNPSGVWVYDCVQRTNKGRQSGEIRDHFDLPADCGAVFGDAGKDTTGWWLFITHKHTGRPYRGACLF